MNQYHVISAKVIEEKNKKPSRIRKHLHHILETKDSEGIILRKLRSHAKKRGFKISTKRGDCGSIMMRLQRGELRTYREVGIAVGLDGKAIERYIRYMRIRWNGTEKQKCKDGYAMEWANRFKAGREYQASVGSGQTVLKELDRK